jgi:ADP-heptose:LPS heptosyltransferase
VFERALLEELAAAGGTILVDRGGSAGEAARVDAVVEGLPGVQTFSGAFAPFAASIAKSKLYCGYDSAGQHVAAACGTPLLTVFAGYASLRMFHRWRPDGPGPKSVVRVDSQDGDAVMEECRRALVSLRVRR